MDFIDRLKQLVESKEFTKTALHKKIGVSRETLYNYLERKTSPTAEEILEMSKKLGIKTEQRSFQDEIFHGDYVGVHKEVWKSYKDGWDHDRAIMTTLANSLADAVTKLTR